MSMVNANKSSIPRHIMVDRANAAARKNEYALAIRDNKTQQQDDMRIYSATEQVPALKRNKE